MKYTDPDLNRLDWLLSEINLAEGSLTENERMFVTGTEDRLNTYGESTFISQRQLDWMERIYEKLCK